MLYYLSINYYAVIFIIAYVEAIATPKCIIRFISISI
nr:MAG TPA: hypothetical protein [Caudoviricetes sp.]